MWKVLSRYSPKSAPSSIAKTSFSRSSGSRESWRISAPTPLKLSCIVSAFGCPGSAAGSTMSNARGRPLLTSIAKLASSTRENEGMRCFSIHLPILSFFSSPSSDAVGRNRVVSPRSSRATNGSGGGATGSSPMACSRSLGSSVATKISVCRYLSAAASKLAIARLVISSDSSNDVPSPVAAGWRPWRNRTADDSWSASSSATELMRVMAGRCMRSTSVRMSGFLRGPLYTHLDSPCTITIDGKPLTEKDEHSFSSAVQSILPKWTSPLASSATSSRIGARRLQCPHHGA
mmetsp:Transcript_25689/g.65291  ORF Transcript_25689/g.65291 Transcript_25689/m.65291 type:complete len:290 (+) Transcript_25689:520-1389(+)